MEFKPTRHDDVMDSDIYEHPSFGTISFSRCQGGDKALFGSSIKHMNYLIMDVSHAELHRSLNRDWIFSRDNIVRVAMSSTQFVDAITMMNTSAQPVTIEHTQREHNIPDPPFFSKVQQFNQEFQDHIDTISKRYDSVIELAKQTNAQKRLVKALELLKQEFKNNLPFINEQFTDQMEHTVKEAKGEVEAFVTTMVHNYGLEAIRKQAPQITDNTKQLKEGSK